VDDLAVPVAQDLHLDVAGALDELFQVDLAVAEGRLGLAPAGLDLLQQLGFLADHPHAAAAAAPAPLQHPRQADLPGEFGDFLLVLGQRAGRRHDGHAGLLGQVPGADLVAERAHGVRGRADEGDAVRVALLGEVRVL